MRLQKSTLSTISDNLLVSAVELYGNKIPEFRTKFVKMANMMTPSG